MKKTIYLKHEAELNQWKQISSENKKYVNFPALEIILLKLGFLISHIQDKIWVV